MALAPSLIAFSKLVISASISFPIFSISSVAVMVGLMDSSITAWVNSTTFSHFSTSSAFPVIVPQLDRYAASFWDTEEK